MIQPVVIFFVVLSLIFASTHGIAVSASLYWYYWWFDILMHFWGGLLIALGVTTLATFRRFDFKSSYRLVFLTSVALVIVWELFEWIIGVVSPQEYWIDTSIDMFLGIFGATVGYVMLKRFKI